MGSSLRSLAIPNRLTTQLLAMAHSNDRGGPSVIVFRDEARARGKGCDRPNASICVHLRSSADQPFRLPKCDRFRDLPPRRQGLCPEASWRHGSRSRSAYPAMDAPPE